MARIIMVKLSEEEYKRLAEKSKEEGYALLSDYLRTLILRSLGVESPGEAAKPAVEQFEKKLLGRLERKLQDIVNPWTQRIEKLSQQISVLYEQLDELRERINTLEKEVRELKESPRATSYMPHTGYRRTGFERGERRRRSAIERLKEQGVVFESDVRWLKDRTAFFEKLKREGAIVVNASGERIAVDREFWIRFLEKLEEIRTSDEEEVRGRLDEQEYRLFSQLRKAGVVFYDAKDGKWLVDMSAVEGV